MTFAPPTIRTLAACVECGREMRIAARGMCVRCYKRLKKAGGTVRRPKFASERDRFLSHVTADPVGCWRWDGAGKGNGYGIVYHNRRVVSTHRVAYELFVGPIPDGMVIDHLCHVAESDCPGGHECQHRRCVNPAHIQAVTTSANLRRGMGFIAEQARRTHCPQGHPLSGANLYVSRGHRSCRSCGLASAKARREARRAA